MANKSKRTKKQTNDILWRLLVFIISGIVLDIWGWVVFIFLLVNWFIVIFSGKRNNDIGMFSNYWAAEVQRFVKYLSFETNEKPFPFNELVSLKRK